MTDTAAETTAATAPNPRHKWYIVHAYSNFETKVAGGVLVTKVKLLSW